MRFRTAALGLAAWALLVPLARAAPAIAEPPTTIAAAAPTTPPAPRAPRRHALYVELFGKGGLWGLGYDYLVRPRFAIGGTVSYFAIDGEHVASISPYATLYLLGTPRHRWFVQGGPQLVHLERPSPVPEWSGTSSTGIGAELSSGYELRTRVLFRAFAMGTVGKGGVAPWIGVSLGVTL